LVVLGERFYNRRLSIFAFVSLYLRREEKVGRPPLVGGSLLFVTDHAIVASAQVEPRAAVPNRPASRSVWMTLDGESLRLARLLAAAGRVAALISGQVATEMAAHVDRVVLRRVVLDCPQLLLAQRRASRVDLEAERLGGEVAALAVEKTQLPRQHVSTAANVVGLLLHLAVAVVSVSVHSLKILGILRRARDAD